MTYQQALQTSLDCQDACNLSGVVYSFARAMDAICEQSRTLGHGTEWRNRHPAVTLFVDKLASLNGTQCCCETSTRAFSKAFAEVEALLAEAAKPSISAA